MAYTWPGGETLGNHDTDRHDADRFGFRGLDSGCVPHRARELVAARRGESGGWEIVCIRHGRLAGTVVSPRGGDPMVHVRVLQATAEVVPTPEPGAMAALVEETEILLRWLESPGVRIVELDGSWTCPVGGAGALRHELEPVVAAAHEVVGFDRDAGDASRDFPRRAARERHRRAG